MFALFSVPARSEIPDVGKPTVRIGYVIPSNRTEQTNGVAVLRAAFLLYRVWCREQMELNGFPDTTFNVETETDGWTPKVWVIHTSQTDAYLASNMWTRVGAAAADGGAQLWKENNVWFLVGEAHIMQPDGSLFGHYAGATGDAGSGVAVVSGDCLAMCAPKYLTNNAAYNGLTIPEIGAYPLVYGTTFGSGEGSTLSSLCSTYLGANLHEFGHAFHLHHDFRNDWNFYGNVMGNGFRGMKGYLCPARYPDDFTRCSYAFAIQRNLSRFYRPNRAVADTLVPNLSAVPSGTVSVEGGLAVLNFSVSDASGLGLALLVDESGEYGGGVLAEQTLSGTSSDFTIRTPYYLTTGTVTNQIRVQDVYGNETSQTFVYSVSGVTDRCPWPNIKITPPAPAVGESVTFDATGSSDPDDTLDTVTVEWDFDNDGTYDTAPMACTSTFATNFPAAGLHLVKVRVTDPHGASFVSSPVGMRVGLVTRYVWADSPLPAAPYNSWLNAAHTIQDAVDAAADGEEIVVAPGAYNAGGAATPGAGALNRVRIGKAVTVRSEVGPEQTFIVGVPDSGGFGAAAVRCAYVGTNATLSGFTLSNGWTRASGDDILDRCGGGALVVGGTVTNCALLANSANLYGGGSGIYYGGAVLNCTLADNRATRGGAVDVQYAGCATSLIQWCEIHDNVAEKYGGGVYCRDAGLVANSLVYSNTAGRYGGGVHLAYACRAENCAIYANAATDTVTYGMGGGVMCEFDGPELYNCTVADNSAGRQGGGVFIKDGNGSVVNSILYFNAAASGTNWLASGATGSQIIYSCTTPSDGLPGGAGCAAGDPLFTDEAAHDYSLLPLSPAHDAGLNSAWASNTLDAAGNPRIGGDVVDMGAYERFQTIISLATVVTYAVSNITATTADCGGVVTDDGGATVTAKGLVWGTAVNPTTDSHTGGGLWDAGARVGAFAYTIPDLTGGETYYVRAYAVNSCGTVYGDAQVLTTIRQSPGNGLDFDGSNDCVDIADDETLDLTTDYTLECWFRADEFGDLRGLISKYMTASANGYFLRLSGTELDFDGRVTSGLGLQAGCWYHAAAVNSGGTRTLYVNGRNVPLGSGTMTVAANTDSLRLGSDFSGRYLNGRMDEMRIRNVARTEADILATMHREPCGSEAGLVACYTFTAKSGAELSDLTGNGHTGTLTNMDDADWVVSGVPCAFAIADATDLRGVWSGQPDSQASGRMTIEGASVTGEVFAVFGHDNADETQNAADVPAGASGRLGRVWRVERGGDVAADVVWDVTGLTGPFALLVDDDGVFADGTLVSGTTWEGVFRANDVNLTDVGYLTLAYTTESYDLPYVETLAVSNVTYHSAVCGGNVTDEGATSVTGRGVVWNTGGAPTLTAHEGCAAAADGGPGVFSCSLTGLAPKTNYFVRAYAVNSRGTNYGDAVRFTTPAKAPGGCVELTGSSTYNQKICTVGAITPAITNELTVEAWVRLDDVTKDSKVVCRFSTVPSTKGYYLGVMGGRIYPAVWDSDLVRYSFTNGVVTAGKWTHLAMTYKRGDALITYVNGVEAGRTNVADRAINSADDIIHIGVGPDSISYYVDGRIDEVRVWHVARTQAEILETLHRELTGTETGLSCYYNLNELSGDRVEDLASSGSHALLYGSPTPVWKTAAWPCAADITDRQDLRAVWSARTNSLPSSLATMANDAAAEPDCAIFGHDGGALSVNLSDKPGTLNWRLQRVWQTEDKGVADGVLRFDCSEIADLISVPERLRLLRDADGVFEDAALLPGVYSNDVFTVTNQSFATGTYYTLGELQTGPYTYYADASRPDDSGNGTSWATAKRTIQSAVDLTAWGDTVLVTNGVYGEGGIVLHGQGFTNRVAITKGITVKGVDGPSGTFIVGASDHGTNGPAAARCVWISAGLLTGFTITNGHTQAEGDWACYQRGGGVFLNQGGTVSNCVIAGCSANITGGGVDFHYGGCVAGCVIEGNSVAYGGGGVNLHKGALLDRCVVRDNAADGKSTQGGGGLYFYSGGTARNCLIADNQADNGGGVYMRAGATNALLESCTVAGNSGSRIGGVYIYDGTNLNCVIYGNTGLTESNNIAFGSLRPTVAYCCVSPTNALASHGGEGCFDSDPLFANADDYRLSGGSPCLNVGLKRSWMSGATDLDGTSRVRGGAVDLGAYEYGASGNALNFNGTNACVSLGTDESLALTNGAFTIEAWIKPVEKTGSCSIFSRKKSGSANPGYAFYINTWSDPATADAKLRFETQGHCSGTSDPVIRWCVWQHVAVTWDGAALRFYVNGEEKAGTSSISFVASTDQAMLGAFSNTNLFYKGAMDEVRVWSTARGADELRDAMHTTLDGDEAGLLAYYRCDATDGASLPDMSGNGLDGALVNGATLTVSQYPVADTLAGLANLRGDWIARTHSLASSILSVSNAVVAGTDFRVFGHDGGALEQTVADKPGNLVWRLGRVWRTEGEGTVTGDFAFDCSGIGGLIWNADNLRLVSGSGDTLVGADTVAGTYAGGVFTVSGVSLADGASYTLGEQGSPVTITAEAGAHGKVEPSGAVSVPYGGGTNFVVAPDTYWHVGDVTTNGASVGAVTEFAWANVTADGSFEASFAANVTSHETPEYWLAQFGVTGDFETADVSDSDNDGYTAWQEYVADTDPTNAVSHFRVTAISNGPPVRVFFEPGSSVRAYTLQATTNLAAGPWADVPGQGPRAGAGGADAMADDAGDRTRFYRVKVEVP
ncbi:MAG: choice-of-anchor Q domain-containing protein [Kiritimatiellae bacterium]|nr:choice-of-anchor Q domain-containing protein [Kiritimatiellia bacterium]